MCIPEEPKAWAKEGHEKTNNGKNPSEESHYTVKENETTTSKPKNNATDYYETLLCGEVKITDLALIWFTCGLVIVGYFIGRITYSDIFGDNCETGFCWVYNVIGDAKGFVFDRESKLNYQT